MGDVPNWVIALAAIIGSPLGSYVAVRVSVARLEMRALAAERDIERHERWIERHDLVGNGQFEFARLQKFGP